MLVTCVGSKQAREGVDFLPLTVDYEEKLYSVGRVPGSFGRREGKAPDKAILISRLIDRPIRPLFAKGYCNDVQVMAVTLSAEDENPTDTLAMLGASVAIGLAGLPFKGPLGAVRVARCDGHFVANAKLSNNERVRYRYCCGRNRVFIMMVEAGCKMVSEKDILAA